MNQSFIFLCFILHIFLCSSYEIESSNSFCVSEDSLSITAYDYDNNSSNSDNYYYELVPVAEEGHIELICGICNNNESAYDPRLWYQRNVEGGAWHEVELGMKAPLTENRVYETSSHNLVIHKFEASTDMGHYKCRNQEDEVQASYFLDGSIAVNLSEPFITGNSSTWLEFEQSLEPLEALLDELAADDAPDVALLWSSWGQCDNCGILGMGERWKRGRCQVLSPAHINLLPYNLTAVSCRSPLLEMLNMTSENFEHFRAVPDFILYEECECRHEDYTLVTQEKLQSELNEGDDLSIVCPGAAGLDGKVEWKKGLSEISSEGWTMVGRGGRIRVDVLGILHIERAVPAISGRYTCLIAGRSWRFLITVKAAYLQVSEEFKQNVHYFFLVLALTSVLYFAYLAMLCIQPLHVKQAIARSYSRQHNQKEEI